MTKFLRDCLEIDICELLSAKERLTKAFENWNGDRENHEYVAEFARAVGGMEAVAEMTHDDCKRFLADEVESL